MTSERRASQPLGLALCGSVPRLDRTYASGSAGVKEALVKNPHPARKSRRRAVGGGFADARARRPRRMPSFSATRIERALSGSMIEITASRSSSVEGMAQRRSRALGREAAPPRRTGQAPADLDRGQHRRQERGHRQPDEAQALVGVLARRGAPQPEPALLPVDLDGVEAARRSGRGVKGTPSLRNSTTSGSAFRRANGARSDGRQERSTRRSVVGIGGKDGSLPDADAPTQFSEDAASSRGGS